MSHLINDTPCFTPDGQVQMIVEIPAGTNDKWHVETISGQLVHEIKDGKPRRINYLSYPFNYGCIGQTCMPESEGGDGDALDIILLAPAQERGKVLPVKIIGGLKLSERGQSDNKLLAVLPDGDFDCDSKCVSSIDELNTHFPGVMHIIETWLSHYKGPTTFSFDSYLSPQEARDLIEHEHQLWQSQKG